MRSLQSYMSEFCASYFLKARPSVQRPFALLRHYLNSGILAIPREALPPPLSYYNLMRQSCAYHAYFILIIRRAFAVRCQLCLPQDFPVVISVNLSLHARAPIPVVLMVHLAVSSHQTSAFPDYPTGRHQQIPLNSFTRVTVFRNGSIRLYPSGL